VTGTLQFFVRTAFTILQKKLQTMTNKRDQGWNKLWGREGGCSPDFNAMGQD